MQPVVVEAELTKGDEAACGVAAILDQAAQIIDNGFCVCGVNFLVVRDGLIRVWVAGGCVFSLFIVGEVVRGWV